MATGDELLRIANGISALKRECFGKGPARARAFANGDYLFVVLEGGFIDAELTLANAGIEGAIREFRVAFDEVTRQKTIEIVEETLGRTVVDATSEVLTRGDVQIEVFLLEGAGSSRP